MSMYVIVPANPMKGDETVDLFILVRDRRGCATEVVLMPGDEGNNSNNLINNTERGPVYMKVGFQEPPVWCVKGLGCGYKKVFLPCKCSTVKQKKKHYLLARPV